MADIIPFGQCGKFVFEPFTDNGATIRMRVGDRVIMVDDDEMRRTHAPFLEHAHGDVLIGGLGLGFVVVPLLTMPQITSVLVIEIEQDIIDHVMPPLMARATIPFAVMRGMMNIDMVAPGIYDTIYLDLSELNGFDAWTTNVAFRRAQRDLVDRCDDRLRQAAGAWCSCWGYDSVM
jgi:hypothetical protein